MTLRLNPEERSRLARQILSRLEESVSASSAQLRGSLAEGGGDPYSDIDVVWEVPDEAFGAALEGMEKALSRVRPLASLRLDPAFQKSDRRRLIFVQFERVPLFWRVDIDLFAASVDDPQYDIDNPRARGDHFSRTHSALMNSVAAIRALLRGDEATAAGLVSRGFERIALPVPAGGTRDRLLKLVDDIYDADDGTALLAAEIKALYRQAFDGSSGG